MPQLDPRAVWPGWETKNLIGKGSYGAVYEIELDVFGYTEKAALKHICIPKEDNMIEDMLANGFDQTSVTATFKSYLKKIVNEYTLMREMNGAANIVNCDDFRVVQHDDGIGWDIFIKMELLTPLIKALDQKPAEEQVITVAKDMCKALILCKKHGIIHRDIKPQNIFVSNDGDYKLGDFGIARTMDGTSSATHQIGTYNYMAPEVFNNKPYNHTADIYSLGMVLYWLLNERRHPFVPLPPALLMASDMQKSLDRRMAGEQLPAPAYGSKKLKQIVLKACAFDSKKRYQNAEEMLADLNMLLPDGSAKIADDGNEKKKERKGDEGKKTDSHKVLRIVLIAALAVLAGLAILFAFTIRKCGDSAETNSQSEETGNSIETTTSASEETSSSSTEYETSIDPTTSEQPDDSKAVLDHYQNLFVVRDRVSGSEVEYLNIRNEGNSSASIVGFIRKYGGGEVLAEDGEWVRISSGGLTGYVKKEYIATGEEAQQLALEQAEKYVRAESENVRIRTTPSTEGEVIAYVPTGTIMSYEGQENGFYHVNYDKWIDGYVAVDVCGYDWYLAGASSNLENNHSGINQFFNAKVGDYVILGSFEQDNNSKNGKEDIEWRVLAREGNAILVISRYALDCQRYNEILESVTWKECSLRSWLNEDFYNAAFSPEEQKLIKSTKVVAEDNPKTGVSAGENTIDRVFLLSYWEAYKYFSSDEDRKCEATQYALARGVFNLWKDSITYWWLRTPGSGDTYAAKIWYSGEVYHYGYPVTDNDTAVRPAIWINLDP